jgi:hypothetical protein
MQYKNEGWNIVKGIKLLYVINQVIPPKILLLRDIPTLRHD